MPMQPSHPTPDPHAGHAAEHHGSWAPIVAAAAVGFLYLGILYPRVALPVGVAIGAVGLGRWLREDVVRFRGVVRSAPAEHGASGPVWGMALFIATEVLIFGSIFAIWFVGKFQAYGHGHEWRPGHLGLPLVATGINTAVLVASGGTLHWGYLGLKKNQYRRFVAGLVLTILLGLAFLVQQVREYLSLIDEGLSIQTKLYGSSFFMLTGTHGAHVAGGLFFLSIVLWRSLKRTQSAQHHVALETAAFYWHFVDVVWLFLFVVVYLEWI